MDACCGGGHRFERDLCNFVHIWEISFFFFFFFSFNFLLTESIGY